MWAVFKIVHADSFDSLSKNECPAAPTVIGFDQLESARAPKSPATLLCAGVPTDALDQMRKR